MSHKKKNISHKGATHFCQCETDFNFRVVAEKDSKDILFSLNRNIKKLTKISIAFFEIFSFKIDGNIFWPFLRSSRFYLI